MNKDKFICQGCGKEVKVYLKIDANSVSKQEVKKCIEEEDFSSMFICSFQPEAILAVDSYHCTCELKEPSTKPILSPENVEFLRTFDYGLDYGSFTEV